MKRLRIRGLVRFAKQVRQELAAPISPARLGELRFDVAEAVAAIKQMVKDKGIRVADLPAPSRKAYQFLKGLNLDAVPTADTPAGASPFPPDSISFVGLKSHFDYLLDQLAQAADPSEQEEIHELITSASASIEDEVRARNIRPEQITKQSREMRGWLAYFAQREHFDAYCAAVHQAEPIFRTTSTWPAAKSTIVLVHFRPMRGMYRIRAYADAMQVLLPTPMICFDEALLWSVARLAFKKKGDRRGVHEAAASEPYQKIGAAVERLGGIVRHARGVHHDLDASFDRVNAAYFHGRMPRPRLVWSRNFATRKFGHYDHAHDTIMVNAVLDRATVPAYAVDFIVHHEVLHKQMGVIWQGSRLAAHTAQFKERTQEFAQYEQARAVLRKLAAER